MGQRTIHALTKTQLSKLPDFKTLEFGKLYTDHMFSISFQSDSGWTDAKIAAFENLSLSPATLVLHYAQEIFEGMKAYYRVDGRIGLFRPLDNFKRMNKSALRMVMPTLEESFALESLLELIRLDQRWVPNVEGASLYIRPTMIATDALIGLKPSTGYLFYIIMSPVGAYFKVADKGLRIYVEETYVRAVPGGTGEAKTGANYAASLLAGVEAQKKGFTQVLWLDGVHRRYVEEVGAMNIFFVYGDKVVTPKLNGSILQGITRKSVIELLASWGNPVEEATLDIHEIVSDIASGKLTESFGTGTAAVISPVGSLYFQGKDHIIQSAKIGQVTQKIFSALTDIQYGRA
ncbi:MAG: branched-chain amino acid aminotransferase, partial [Candidatus Margulisiibacteriota bacterium]